MGCELHVCGLRVMRVWLYVNSEGVPNHAVVLTTYIHNVIVQCVHQIMNPVCCTKDGVHDIHHDCCATSISRFCQFWDKPHTVENSVEDSKTGKSSKQE